MADNDKVEIINILNLYGFALDARAWDLFDLIFTEDVEAVFGPAGAGWNGIADFPPVLLRLAAHKLPQEV